MRKEPLPVKFKETPILVCDGCGIEVGGVAQIGAGPLGWLRQMAAKEVGRGGVEIEDVGDFCAECRPKIERAQKQEREAIKAEKLAAAADSHGVT